MGLIDELVDTPEAMLEAARAWIKATRKPPSLGMSGVTACPAARRRTQVRCDAPGLPGQPAQLKGP